MPNQINRDIYVLSSKVKDPIDYVRLTNDIPIAFTFRDYDIPPGSAAQVYVQKPSGKAVYDTAGISGNVVTVTVTDQMFAELGVSDLQIRITQGDEKLVSFSQPVRVHPNYTEGDAQQSQNGGGFFDDAEQAVENANTAAENANSAADAANAAAEAVGGAVSGVINDNQVSEYTTYSSQKLGNFSQLLTTAKNTFVAAINELVLKIGDLKELATTEKTDIVSAINEIEGDKLDKENIANNLTTTQEGYALDARQGKALDGKIAEKLAKTDVVNGLTETAAGKALDARQGKALNEKIDNTNEAVSELNSKLKLTHTFSVSDEIDTGETWIDGKKIYRKVIKTTDAISANETFALYWDTINCSEIWIDLQNSYIRSSDSGQIYPLCVQYQDYFIGAWVNSNGVRLYSNSGWNEKWTKVVTVRYTKQ